MYEYTYIRTTYIHLCSFHILARSSGPSRHLRSLPSFAIYFCVSLPHLPSVSCLHSHFYINGRTFQRQKQQQFGFLSQQFARFEDAYYKYIDRNGKGYCARNTENCLVAQSFSYGIIAENVCIFYRSIVSTMKIDSLYSITSVKWKG